MGVTNLIYNDDTTRVAYDTSQAKYANFQPSALAILYLSNAGTSGYAYMNNQANTWLIGKANSSEGYTAIFGWTFPRNKDIYIRTDQNDGNVWFWWDGLADARTEFGTNCTYYKEIKANNYGGISNFAASTAINCHSGWSNNLVIDGHTYWSQTWAGFSNDLLPILYTWVSASRTYINGEIMAPGEGLLILDFTLGNYGTSDRVRMYGLYTYGSGQGLDFSHLPPDKQGDVLPIYNNSNVNKYYDYVSGSTEKKVYNSAVLNISSGIYYMLIGDIPFAAYQKVGSSSTVYGGDEFDYRYTKNGIYISGNANGCIFGNWNTFVYTKGLEKSSYQTLEFHGSDLPVFIDPEEYMNYILNPYNPEPTGDAEVKVSYIVPDDEYTYCNITWKMNSEPENKDDGHTATLLKDESVINITNLVEGAKYIFKIFTNKSESNPFPYTVGEAPVPPPEPEIGYVLFKDGEFGHPEIFTIQNATEYSRGLSDTGSCGMEIQNNEIWIHMNKNAMTYQETSGSYFVRFEGNGTYLPYTKSPYTISNETYAKRFINTLNIKVSGSASINGSWTGGAGRKPLVSITVRFEKEREISDVISSRTLCILRPDEANVEKTWSIENYEFALQYVDEQITSGGTLWYPALYVGLENTNNFNYVWLTSASAQLRISEIILKLDKHLRP